jgi:hypothetical protein
MATRRNTTLKIRDGVWTIDDLGTWGTNFGTLRITVGKEWGYPPAGILVLRCRQVFGDKGIRLKSKRIEEAKAEALKHVSSVVFQWATKLARREPLQKP